MKQFQSHHLLNIEEAKQYAVEKLDIFNEVEFLDCEEIGDGNINYVFRIRDVKSGKSLIIKQADEFLRSSGRELDLDHNRIEAEVLQIHKIYAKSYIPKVYMYDSCMYAVMMEDISDYRNLRNILIDGKQIDRLSNEMAKFLVSYLLQTSDVILDSYKKKKWVKQFINPELCKISEDLVFTEPYNDYKNRNNIQNDLLPFVREHIYNNENLIFKVNRLRFRFMNLAQSLLHGDLHTGSIFVNDLEKVKIIDPEFAFYGPMGYDIGNVLGNLIFPLVYHSIYKKQSQNFVEWLMKCIRDMYDNISSELYKTYERDVTLDLYKNQSFKDMFIQEIMDDAIGFAGTEIIRRSIGDTKVQELNLITDENVLIKIEKILLTIGSKFVTDSSQIKKGNQLVNIIDSVMEEYKYA